jgi:hypothetical protein
LNLAEYPTGGLSAKIRPFEEPDAACYGQFPAGPFMKKLFLSIPILICAGFGILHSQVSTDKPFRIVRLDPALDDILAPGTKLEVLGEHFGLTEGPVWVRDGKKGYLLFSDCAANVIYKWSSGEPLSVFLEKSGYTGKDVRNVGDQTISGRLAILLIGSNGLTSTRRAG